MKAPTQNDPQTRRPAAFTLETEETTRPSATQKRAPRSFDAEISLTPDEDDPFLAPEESMPMRCRSRRRGKAASLSVSSRSVRWVSCSRLPSGCGRISLSAISSPAPTGWVIPRRSPSSWRFLRFLPSSAAKSSASCGSMPCNLSRRMPRRRASTRARNLRAPSSPA